MASDRAAPTKSITVVSNTEQLAEFIERSAQIPRIIAVDGAMEAGKSTSGAALAKRWNVRHVDLDDFVQCHTGQFTGAIDVERLSREVCNDQNTVLTGVCMRLVLEKLSITDALHVYMKRTQYGLWVDEAELYGNFLEEVADVFGGDLDQAASEVRSHHRAQTPDQHADVIFERTSG